MNLLAETLEILSMYGKTPTDVRWVGHRPREGVSESTPFGTWDDFARFANFEYDPGYGGNEVEGELVIVGDDWWLERGEYDGSEWWEFTMLPQRPANPVPLRPGDLKDEYFRRTSA